MIGGYTEIILVAVFIVFVAIIIYLVVKKAREKKIDERKEKELRGEKVEKEPLWRSFEWFKNGNIQTIIAIGGGYAILLIAFAKLFPHQWEWYCADSNFFWLSQIIITVFFILGLEKFKFKGRMWLRSALIAIIILAFWERLPKPPDEETQTFAITRQNSNTLTLNVVAPVGRWSEIVEARPGYNWSWHQMDTSYKNIQSLIKVRINGVEVVEERHLPDGNKTGSYSNTVAYQVEFQSKEEWSVDMGVKFIK